LTFLFVPISSSFKKTLMEWMTLEKNYESLKRDFELYFMYRWKKEILKPKTIIIICFTILMLTINLVSYINNNNSTDLVFCFFFLFVLLIYPLFFIIQKIRLMVWLRKANDEMPNVYEFGFDDHGYSYKSEKFNVDYKWDYFSSYELNKKASAIYLYSKSKQLREIMIKRLIGEDNFKSIEFIIASKLPGRIN
jgi:hypothetical protein